jgi:hypothetical protein
VVCAHERDTRGHFQLTSVPRALTPTLYIYASSASTGKQPAPVAAAASSGTRWYCGPSIDSSSAHHDAHKVSEHESLSPLSSSTEEIYVDRGPGKYIDKTENHGEDVRHYREKQPAGTILHDSNPIFDKVQGRKAGRSHRIA